MQPGAGTNETKGIAIWNITPRSYWAEQKFFISTLQKHKRASDKVHHWRFSVLPERIQNLFAIRTGKKWTGQTIVQQFYSVYNILAEKLQHNRDRQLTEYSCRIFKSYHVNWSERMGYSFRRRHKSKEFWSPLRRCNTEQKCFIQLMEEVMALEDVHRCCIVEKWLVS
jgi:hypothetical protein